MNSTRKLLILAFTAILLVACTEERNIHEPGNLVPMTVEQDTSLPFIEVNGAKLHSEAYGPANGTLIIGIHGGPGGDYRSLLNYRDLANQGFRVVFYDQRGSGLSQRFPKDYYTELGLGVKQLMLDELRGVIAHYRTSPQQKVILLGYSWGGILATAYAGKYPNEINGLVVFEPGGLKWDDIMDYIEETRSFELWNEFRNDASYIDQFITGSEDEHEILDYKLAIISGENKITGENNLKPGSFWRSGAVIMDAFIEIGKDYKPDFSEGIENFKRPTLFIYSENNHAYPDTWAQKISASYSSAELFKIMNTGHSGMVADHKVWSEITLPKLITYLNSL